MTKPIRYFVRALLVSELAYQAQAQTIPGGGVGIGTATPDASALLDLTSSTRGLLAPRLTAGQRAAIASPAVGLLVYQTDGAQAGFWYYAASGWTFVNPNPAGDNLGSHTATQDLNLADKQLIGNGGTSGLSVSATGGVGIGTAANAKAALDVSTTTKGFLPPRLTQTQRDALKPGTGEAGLLVYNTNAQTLNIWTGKNWVNYLLDASASDYAPQTYAATYGPQTYIIPPGVTRLQVDIAGASGGAAGGLGGRVTGILKVIPGQVVTIYVGGTNGYNGGGSGGGGNGDATTPPAWGGNGGGASDIRLDGTALSNRVLVAGGGGGGGVITTYAWWGGYNTTNVAGGCGGGLTACDGNNITIGSSAAGGSQSGPGAQGTGSNGSNGGRAGGQAGGGGGGGYYGGAGGAYPGNSIGGGGGGGSSYTDAGLVTSVMHTQGYRSGNGYVTLQPMAQAPVLDASNFTNVPGDNLGNHTATKDLNLGTYSLVGSGSVNLGNNLNLGSYSLVGSGRVNLGNNLNLGTNQLVGNGGTQGLGVSSGGSLLLPAGVIQRGGTAITSTSDLGLYSRVSGEFLRLVTNNAPIRFYADDNAGTTANVSIESNGNVGIGTGNTAPANRLDVQAAGRSGTHPSGRALYVTGDFQPDGSGVEFRHSNGSQGVGIGFNSLYAAGTNPSQHLNLMPRGTGGVGIGTTTPTALLDVNGNAAVRSTLSFGTSARQMLNLYNADYGIGVQGGTQYFRTGDAFAWYIGGAHNDAQFNAGGGTTQMTLKNGFLGVGAGSGSPAAPLELRRDNASPYMLFHTPGQSWFSFGMDQTDGYKIKINGGNGFGGDNKLTISGSNVGIGTTAPAFPLDVQNTVTPGNFAYAYLGYNGNIYTGATGGGTGPVSIRAAGRVVATEFNATSDRRLKHVIGLSNGATDLALLQRLRITDYTLRDNVQFGSRPFKKVIAQEVEEVFPQAVSQHAGFLPDVYALASQAEGQADSLLVLTLPTAIPAKVSQRVKLIGKSGEVIGTVKAASGRTLVLRGARQLAGQDVFVFGLEHPDVRAVDYEALAMLNVSATQELSRQLTELQQQYAHLRAQAQAQATRLDQQQATLQTQATTTAHLALRLQALEAQLAPSAQAMLSK